MSSEQAIIGRQELQEKIVALAWKDEDFRRKFLSDPKRQFEEYLGAKLPENLKITAHQEDENSLHFVIPAKPKADLTELSESDLENIAGGVSRRQMMEDGAIRRGYDPIDAAIESMKRW